MTEVNIYKIAAQEQLRFQSQKGLLAVEDLFKLPLTSVRGDSLNSIAVSINRDLKALGEESFVASTTTPQQAKLKMKLNIVKDVIATVQDANAEALNAKKKADTKKKLLQALDRKQDAALEGMSVDEIKAALANLD